MFEDILGKEEFFDGDENPIEFEYEPRPKNRLKDFDSQADPDGYNGPYDDEGTDEDRPLHEKLREWMDEYIKDHFDDLNKEPDYGPAEAPCDGDCEQCEEEKQEDPDALLCRACGEQVSIPYAYHRECFLKLVRTGKWKNYKEEKREWQQK